MLGWASSGVPGLSALLGCQGLRQQARAELAAAREVAVRLGARSLAEEVEHLAIRARLGPAQDPARPDDRFGLTDRERDVLGLVCAGCTNRQIAERLFIAPKTAGLHVSHILAKLGVTTRGEAAAVAYRLGLAAVASTPATGDRRPDRVPGLWSDQRSG